jgi:hypothetical protein
MRIAAFPLATWVLLSALTASGFAQAQTTSDDQRKSDARAYFNQGLALKQAGRCNEAVDKFAAAQRLYEAPTTLLHLGQCQQTLSKLVEAAESYRTLARMEEKPTWSKEFVAAKKQGQVELAALEPRIPTLTIEVEPRGISGLQLQFDGAPLDAAIVGVPRPVNPGEHRVSASAQGYTASEQGPILREAERRRVQFVLTPAPRTDANVQVVGLPLNTQSAGEPSIQPAPYTPQPLAVPPEQITQAPPAVRTSNAYVVGVDLGGMLPVGTLGEDFGVGFSVGGRGAIRLSNHAIGIDLVFASSGIAPDKISIASASLIDGRLTNGLLGVNYQYYGNPDGASFFLKGGLGYSATSLKMTYVDFAPNQRFPRNPVLDKSGAGAAFYAEAGFAFGANRSQYRVPVGIAFQVNSYSEKVSTQNLTYAILSAFIRFEYDSRM